MYGAGVLGSFPVPDGIDDADFCLRAIRNSEPGASRDGWDGDFCMAAVRQSWKMLSRIDRQGRTCDNNMTGLAK